MCSVCSFIFFVCLGPLPKPLKKKKVLPDKCGEVAEVGILKCDLVWRTLRVYWCSFLGRVNLIQFHLHAPSINTSISLVSSHSLLFFSIQQCSFLDPFSGCALPDSSRWQPCRVISGFAGWIKLCTANGFFCKTLLILIMPVIYHLERIMSPNLRSTPVLSCHDVCYHIPQ